MYQKLRLSVLNKIDPKVCKTFAAEFWTSFCDLFSRLSPFGVILKPRKWASQTLPKSKILAESLKASQFSTQVLEPRWASKVFANASVSAAPVSPTSTLVRSVLEWVSGEPFFIFDLCWKPGFGSKALDPGPWMQGLGSKALDPRPRIQGLGSKTCIHDAMP